MLVDGESKPPANPSRMKRKKLPEETFVACSFEVNEDDFEWLSKNKNRKRGVVWLSKKMSEKGKEVEWQRLPLHEKKEYDLAMAKELSQVAISRALRNLTAQEEMKVTPEQLMKMRWVLTRKSDGSAKARLVVLGFMAHNLTEVATASPTMSKVGRNLILALAAGLKFKVKAGDVTSAFLQTGISLEDEELNVLAPPELSAMFGASDGQQKALRVREAFYGLAHAPRKWWERCVKTMVEAGWRQLLSDKCCFALYEPESMTGDLQPKLAGLAGLHVDDFLLCGAETSEYFKSRERLLNEAFRWGRWNEDNFEFAGCTIIQNKDYSIILNQEVFRTTRLGTVSWLIGSNPDFPADRGFALRPWNEVRFDNAQISIQGNRAQVGNERELEYVFCYTRDLDGRLRIEAAHMALPFGANYRSMWDNIASEATGAAGAVKYAAKGVAGAVHGAVGVARSGGTGLLVLVASVGVTSALVYFFACSWGPKAAPSGGFIPAAAAFPHPQGWPGTGSFQQTTLKFVLSRLTWRNECAGQLPAASYTH
eukprot:g8659.t1